MMKKIIFLSLAWPRPCRWRLLYAAGAERGGRRVLGGATGALIGGALTIAPAAPWPAPQSARRAARRSAPPRPRRAPAISAGPRRCAEWYYDYYGNRVCRAWY